MKTASPARRSGAAARRLLPLAFVAVLAWTIGMVAVPALFAPIMSTTTGGPWHEPLTWEGGVVPGAGDEVVIRGPVEVSQQNAVCAGLTVEASGVLEATSGFGTYLRVTGPVVNRGAIRNRDGGVLYLFVEGDLTNHGAWRPAETSFDGPAPHTLTLGAGAALEGAWFNLNRTGGLVAATDLRYRDAAVHLGLGQLDLAGHRLAVEGTGRIGNGSILGGDLTMDAAAVLNDARLRDVRLYGTVRASLTVTVEGTVTVVDTLESARAVFNDDLVVEGHLVNEGTVRARQGGVLRVLAYGDLTNDGAWRPSEVLFVGPRDSRLSLGAGAAFGGAFTIVDTTNSPTAATPLSFAGATFLLNRGTLRMGSHALTTDAATRLYRGRIAGDVSLHGVFEVLEELTVSGSLTVHDTLRDARVIFGDYLTVEGDLVNEGVVRTRGGGYFEVSVTADVTNRGTLAVDRLHFTGRAPQYLAVDPGASLGGGWAGVDTTTTVLAATPLTFRGADVDLRGGTLDLAGRRLAMEGATAVRNGLVARGDVAMDGTSHLADARARDVTLRGTARVLGTVTVEGVVTAADTLEDAPSIFADILLVKGHFVNDGTLRNHAGGGSLLVDAIGDLTNNGAWRNTVVRWQGAGTRTVHHGETIEAPFEVWGDNVLLTGDNTVRRLNLPSQGALVVGVDATLRVLGPNVAGNGTFKNFGRVFTETGVGGPGGYHLYGLSATAGAGSGLDSLTVEVLGKVPSTYGNAIRSWWRLHPSPASARATLTDATFYYADDQLGAQDESALTLYHSADSGQTWQPLSTATNTTRNPAANFVTVTGVPAWGDFVLTSAAGPVAVVPNVIVQIAGRQQLRVGAPNRFTVHYVNQSDVPSGDLMLAFTFGPHAEILRVEPSAAPGRTPRPLLPSDLDPDDILPAGSAVLFAPSLAPHEERTFTVVALGLPDGPGKHDDATEAGLQSADPQAVPVFGIIVGIIVGGGIGLVIDYYKGAGVHVIEEVLSGEHETFEKAMEKAKRETDADYGDGLEDPAPSIIGKLLESVGDLLFGIPGIIFSLPETVKGIFTAIIEGLERDLERNPAGRPCLQDQLRNRPSGATCAGLTFFSFFSLNKVFSWDPNEKIGPAGAGGFLTAAGRMHYTILFENKKEATAPAYRVVVHDTLAAEFDPETVVFGATSHAGFVTSRVGNVLRWEIEGIELAPNVNPPEGEGFVSFSVMPRPALPSGAVLRNRATIVFDLNPPITTNTFVNTLDLEAPVAEMRPLPEQVEGAAVVLRWRSDDGATGSGVDRVSVYQSRDGGGYTWIGDAAADSLEVPVAGGSTYAFYGIAYDRAGNVQQSAPAPVTTRVLTPVGTESGDAPYTFALGANYPNPFNPETTVHFTLPQAGDVSLRVYDVLGRQVATLVEGHRPAGPQAVRWNAGALGSGVYFCRLVHGSHTAVRSMVLLK